MEYKNSHSIFLRVSLISIIMLFATDIVAQKHNEGVEFEDLSLAAGLQKAAKNKKLLFVDCYTTWCYPCKAMAEKIFPQKKVGDFFNKNFINIKIDMESGEGPKIAEKYDIRQYPTFLIFSDKGTEIGRILGGDGADSFIERTKNAMDMKNSPITKKKEYDNDNTMSNAIAYLESLYVLNNQKEINIFLEKELLRFKPEEKYSHEMWKFIASALKDHKSNVFDIIINDIGQACNILGKDKLFKVLEKNTQEYLVSFITGNISNIQEVNKRIMILGLISDSSDNYSLTLSQICKSVLNNDYSRMAEYLSPFRILSFTDNEIKSIKKIIDSLSGKIDPKIISFYYKNAKIFYEDNLENCKKIQ